METQSNIEMEAQSNIEIELQSNIEMEAQSNIKIEVQSNVKYCKSCGQDHPLESFNNSKTCLKCRSKKNNQNAQKCVAANVNTGYGIIEDFLAVLRTIKGQKIENFKQIININEYITPIDPKEIATSISNNILTNINLNSKKKQVIVELTHKYHAEYENVHVIDEIKGYIQIIFTKLLRLYGKILVQKAQILLKNRSIIGG
ncbi:hypothetical protein C2G38_2212239 [Gigaspora rosea]|uniref:Uncharacterized protein n=1 Tax=Gigaspora rosea TaxID=44941 RepID=A0A397UG62_9GLOM|nr:hypothetical protein C2G38_2212239 [Gigaspora rosea]